MRDADLREHCAKLCEDMITVKPYCDQPWARMALAVAARAIRRGRHLTSSEQLHNLADSMSEDGPEFAEVADKIRALAGPPEGTA